MLLIGLLVAPNLSIAQSSSEYGSGIATYVAISESNVQNGHIIVLENTTYRRSNKPYDFKIVGVHVEKPAVGVNYRADSNRKAIVSTGVATVLVSGEGGPIKKGDSITTSSKPGIGMKAAERGYVIGTAIEDFTPQQSTEQKLIPVSLGVSTINSQGTGTVRGNVRDIFALSALAATESPTVVFKYLVSAIVVLCSLVFAFILFGRSAANSILSLGRNPMAGRFITMGIIINAVIVVAMVMGGIAIAYFVIKL